MSGRVRIVLAYSIGAACLGWAVWLSRGSGLLEHLRGLDWQLVVAAIMIDVLCFVCQGLRWSLLLRPTARLSWFDATRAIYIGLLASEILPMRPGEAVRAWVAARKAGTNVASVVPSILVERFFDGIWLAAGLGITALAVALPPGLVRVTRALGGFLLVGTLGLVYITLRTPADNRPPGDPSSTSSDLRALPQIARGLRAIGTSPSAWVAFALSLIFLSGQIVAFWLMLRAYGIAVPVWTGGAVLMIVHLGTAIPNAPANVGTFQVATIMALTLFGVSSAAAAGFSIVAFVILTAPLWLLGTVAVVWTNDSFAISASRPWHLPCSTSSNGGSS
jgi:uncharacterized membrane protein YbhN (UPF0104 family)